MKQPYGTILVEVGPNSFFFDFDVYLHVPMSIRKFEVFIERHETVLARWIKVIIISLPVIALVGLLNHHYFLTPTLTYTFKPGKAARVLTVDSPTKIVRTADPALGWQIRTDQTRFRVEIPRIIENIQIRTKLQRGTQPYVELVADGRAGADITTIVSSALLDNLDLPMVKNDVYTLWTNDSMSDQFPIRSYSSVEEFLAEPPTDLTRVAVAGVDPMSLVKNPNYEASATSIRIPNSFRGKHRLYVYANNEDINFSLEKIDLNRQTGPDPLTIRIARVKSGSGPTYEWISSITIEDDGQIEAGGRAGRGQSETLSLPMAEPGIYVIDIIASEDVIFRNIASSQDQLAFSNKVFLADGPTYDGSDFEPLLLMADGSQLTVAAAHFEGQQSVIVGGEHYNIDGIKVEKKIDNLSGQTPITIPKGDVILRTDGLITLQAAKLPPAGARFLDLAGQPTISKYSYILAAYDPQTNGDAIDRWFSYDVGDLDLIVKTLTFRILAPGLQTLGGTLGLESIGAKLVRGPFPWNKVWTKATNIFQ